MKENEMTALMLRLADMGITGIKIHYDGGGDSGAIEDISYTTELCALPEDVDDKLSAYGEPSLISLDRKAYEMLENFANDVLLNNLEDWWNNDGGFGDLCICIPSGQYSIYNHIRYYDTEDYMHDGNLFEKTED